MPSEPPLFRREALEVRVSRSLGEIVLVRPLPLTVLTAVALGIAIAVIALFTWGTYTRRTTVVGLIVPDTGLVKIYTPQSGIVLRKEVHEGQQVTRGQVLYTISSDVRSEGAGQTQAALIEQARERKASLHDERAKTQALQDDERNTLQAKVSELSAELTQINDQIAAQTTRVSLAADAATRYAGLLEKDFVSKDQAQQREADLLDQQAKLHGLERDRANTNQALRAAMNDLAGLTLKQQNQLAQLDRNVMDVDQSLIESEARSKVVTTAPETGIATAVIAEPGQTVDVSRPLASIVPDGARWQAYLFVPSTAVGFIKPGDAVLVRYQAYPYQKFGQYQGRVASIARTALSADELATSGGSVAALAKTDSAFYRVTVVLRDQHVMAYGKMQPLQAGMSLQADILQDRRRLYEWVLEPLYTLTGKL